MSFGLVSTPSAYLPCGSVNEQQLLLSASAVHAGTASVAHAEALLGGTVFKAFSRGSRRRLTGPDRNPAADAVDAAHAAEPGDGGVRDSS
jgi:hypothetical protein